MMLNPNVEVSLPDTFKMDVDRLRCYAQCLLARESNAQSIQATALVNSALCDLWQQNRELFCSDRVQFLACAYRRIQQVLIEHARARNSQRRDISKKVSIASAGIQLQDPVDQEHQMHEEHQDRLAAMAVAMEDLGKDDQEMIRLLQHAYFGKLTQEEIAQLEEMSTRTVRRRLSEGKLLLRRAIEKILADQG